MTNTQITHIQIDNYGPWTVTPEPRREVDLQTLQSRLYADLAQLFGNRDGYIFFSRFDNMIAVTNGLDEADHALIQESVANRYPVTVSMGTGTHEAPATALSAATDHLQEAGSAQAAGRTGVLAGQPEAADPSPGDVQIAHFDVVDATGKYTDQLDAFSAFARIERIYVTLLTHLHAEYGALAFFVGGDNFIAVCPDLDRAEYQATIDHVRERVGADLRVGVGRGATACDAGLAAKDALERSREAGGTVRGDLPAVTER